MQNVAIVGAALGLAIGILIAPAHAAGTPAVASLTMDNVHLRASDPLAGARWYIDHLEAQPGVSPTQVVLGGLVVAFVKTDTTQPSQGSVIDHIALSVADVSARAAAMTRAGARRQAVSPELPGFEGTAMLVDPHGVAIELLNDAQQPGFHHVHLRVPQPARALDWFASMLGGERGKLKGRTDGVRFGRVWLLADQSAAGTPAPSADRAIQNIAWQVTDMTSAAKALRERGVQTVVEPRALGALWYAFFEGIDGVRVELLQRP